MNNPHYFLYIGLLLAAIIGAWWGIGRLRELHQNTVSADDTVNPTVPTVEEPEPEPEPAPIQIIRSATTMRPRRNRWGHMRPPYPITR